ncbi:hypothetical protein PIB30_094269, partial [Stylosanthes scabra]|nr:hypothetical protein [Stylosanthes scabra]
QVDAETKGDLSSRSLLSEFKSGHDLEWCCLGQEESRLRPCGVSRLRLTWVTFGLGKKPSTTRDLRHQHELWEQLGTCHVWEALGSHLKLSMVTFRSFGGH